jgi:putative membrane protein
MVFPGGRRAVGLALALAVTSGAAAACDSAQAASTGSAADHLSARDVGWLNRAHQANESEIQAGQLAVSNADTADIRSVGAVMVTDHSALDTRLIVLANRLHVGLVQSPTVAQVELGDQLSSELGFAFDNTFVGSMMTAHQMMINATRAEIRDGSSPAVVALARQALPVLEKHLRMLKAVAGSG